MPDKIRISKRVVDLMAQNQTVWDSSVPGFGVRKQTRRPSYFVCTTIRGKQRWITIGQHGVWTPDTARDEALKLLGTIRQGLDPRLPRHKRMKIVGLAERYLVQHAHPHKRPSSVRTDEQNLKNHILPLLGHFFVDEITETHIAAFHDAVRSGRTAVTDVIARRRSQGGGKVTTGGAGVANRCLTLLSTMFNLAERWSFRPVHTNPVRSVRRFPEKFRERFLSHDEVGRLLSALSAAASNKSESEYAIAAIRLLIFTGARLSEILTLQWSFIDAGRTFIRLPISKTGKKTIALNRDARSVLAELPRVDNNPYVIVGGKAERHLVDLQRPWQRVRKNAGLTDVRLHDLRHSFASFALKSGVPLAVIGKMLGHNSTNTTARYAHLADEELLTAAEKVSILPKPQ